MAQEVEGVMGLSSGASGGPRDRAEEDQAWLDLVGRSGETAPHNAVYRLRLTGSIPPGLTAIPKDPRPPHRARGQAILEGRWRFGSCTVTTPPDHAPWGPPFPSLHFADRIHRFHWLRDVAALGSVGEARARSLIASWIETFGKWEAFAWRVGATADRQINLLSAGPWLIGSLQGASREGLLDLLARQGRHLLVSGGEEQEPTGRFRIAVATAISGAVIAEMPKALDVGLGMLEQECSQQILADGGHISRSPEALAEALFDIQVVEELLLRLGMKAPAFLTRLQPRMAAMLGFFTLPDGGLLADNGGGDGLIAGSPSISQAALSPYGATASKFSFARLSGYQRVQAEELTLYLDTGQGPGRLYGGRTHAGGLSITIDDGPDRLIGPCAAHADLDPVLRDAARRTPAHSVLSLNGEDSAIFAFDPLTGLRAPDGPSSISAHRLEENDQYLLEGQHGGWRVRHGLIYRRRLYIGKDGARIIGEESLSRPMSETTPAAQSAVPYAIRFHLHPGVQVVPGEDGRTVFLGLSRRQRVWRFRSEALLSVENSRYWGGGAAQKTQQLVIRGEADPNADGSRPPNRVRWALSRIEPGV
jgi:uncharacterized heparinase superfamily protein